MIFLSTSLYAQDYEKVAPKLPEAPMSEQQPMIQTQSQVSAEGGAVAIKELRAIVFLKSMKEVHKGGLRLDQLQFGLEKTFISANDFPVLQSEGFKEEMQSFLGHSLDMKRLDELIQKTADYYRRQGQPIIWIRIPEQKVNDGILQLVVTESTLEKVNISLGKWTDEKDIRDQIRVKKGDLVRQNILLSDLDWMNRNSFRQVSAAYKAGQEPGTTDIDFHVKDRFPARFFAGYENTGNDTTGKDRWCGGFNWSDAFGITNNLFNYQFTTSSDFDDFRAHSASDIFPLPWRHLLSTFCSYNDLEAELSAPLNLRGQSWNIGARYIIPLPKISLDENLWFESNAQVGFDFKQSNNNLEFGGTLVSNTLTDINQFVYNYNAALHDSWGATSISLNFYQSPGGWSDNNKEKKFQTSRAEAQADYLYANFSLSRRTELPWNFALNNFILGQWSNANLLASEQLNLGGRDTIRGYEESETRGDEGWYTRNELCTPPVSFGELFGCKEYNDHLVFLAFWDYSVVQNKHLLAGENRDTELSSIGPGIRYTIAPYLNASLDYGFQLLDSGANSQNNSKLHLSITLSY